VLLLRPTDFVFSGQCTAAV